MSQLRSQLAARPGAAEQRAQTLLSTRKTASGYTDEEIYRISLTGIEKLIAKNTVYAANLAQHKAAFFSKNALEFSRDDLVHVLNANVAETRRQ